MATSKTHTSKPEREPTAELDARYSSDGATPTAWPDAVHQLESSPVFWSTTVRRDRRVHVTPLLAVWLDGALHFCTGPTEQKAKNLEHDAHCALTTGCNSLDDGLDVVVEGVAVPVADDARLRRIAAQYESKYGADWHFDVRDGRFHHQGGEAIVFAIEPHAIYAFRKGEPFSHTRFRVRDTPAVVRTR
jgi:hypothetical protein